tara:strand:+ start:276 stop:557 length:282 start_codon:yes stop_codon:yes gene_type:complete
VQVGPRERSDTNAWAKHCINLIEDSREGTEKIYLFSSGTSDIQNRGSESRLIATEYVWIERFVKSIYLTMVLSCENVRSELPINLNGIGKVNR